MHRKMEDIEIFNRIEQEGLEYALIHWAIEPEDCFNEKTAELVRQCRDSIKALRNHLSDALEYDFKEKAIEIMKYWGLSKEIVDSFENKNEIYVSIDGNYEKPSEEMINFVKENIDDEFDLVFHLAYDKSLKTIYIFAINKDYDRTSEFFDSVVNNGVNTFYIPVYSLEEDGCVDDITKAITISNGKINFIWTSKF